MGKGEVAEECILRKRRRWWWWWKATNMSKFCDMNKFRDDW